MKVCTVLFSVFLLFVATVSAATNLDGRWQGMIESPDGEMDVIFNFSVEGNTLTGFSESALGELQFINGKVEGDDYYFEVDINGMTLPHEGSVSDNILTMNIEGVQDGLTFSRMDSAPFEGTWRGYFEGPDGEMELTYIFQTDGDVLTGTVGSEMGDLPILNGKADGNSFTFEIDTGNEIIYHECTCANNTITMDFPDFGGVMTLNRLEE